MPEIDTMPTQMLDEDGSDLHLSVGMPPKIRSSGSIEPLQGWENLTPDTVEVLLKEITSETRWREYLLYRDLDLACEIPGLARFRGSFLYNHWGMAAVVRQIPVEILSFDTLNLPDVLRDVCAYREGVDFCYWSDREWKINYSGSHDRLHQRELSEAHHHHRGSNRIRPSQEDVSDHPS